MNSFVNDGSFLERFKQNASQQQCKSTLITTESSSSHELMAETNTKEGPKPGAPKFFGSRLSSSLSAQLGTTKKANKTTTNALNSKEKPKIFDDTSDFDFGDIDPKTKEIIENLSRSVALLGKKGEQMAKERHKSNPAYWFLYDANSQAYKYFVNLMEQQRKVIESWSESNETSSSSRTDAKGSLKREIVDDDESSESTKRKRKSRWGDVQSETKVSSNFLLPAQIIPPVVSASETTSSVASPSASSSFSSGYFTSANFSAVPSCSKDEEFSNVAPLDAGQLDMVQNSTEEQQSSFRKQILACQLAAKALAQAARMKDGQTAAVNVSGYDSDEDTEGGTWEHKKRQQEMEKTKELASKLTTQSTGKHFIGDFLPPEELKKFYEALNKSKSSSTGDKSDYQDNKLQEDNVGYKLLQKMGWTTGKGLGANEQGITAPVNKGRSPNDLQGLGAPSTSTTATEEDDLFDVYRKRMMLAYRFRPNPLNNPRRPYY